MKSTLILVAAAGALAQNLGGLPACAATCIQSAIAAAGCPAGDVRCQCGPAQEAISKAAAPCVLGACAATDLVVIATAGPALCAAFSATATAPVVSATGTPAPRPSVTGSATSSTSLSTTPAITTGRVIPTTSVPANVTSARVTGSPSNSTSTRPAGSGTTSAPGSGTNRPGSGTTSAPNAAGTPAVFGAGALVGLIGLIAAL